MYKQYIFLFICTILFSFCDDTQIADSTEKNQYPIIPAPKELTHQKGQFVIDKETEIYLENDNTAWQLIAKQLQNHIQKQTNMLPTIAQNKSDKNVIIFEQKETLEKEEYTLIVDPYQIIIQAKSPNGAFYAIQSLRQLISEKSIPSVKINDTPRFPYRGMHLDVARHFYDVKEVKKYIDYLAMYKLNYFHWHLTDDQGWRIEIKKYPKLTSIGGFRNGTLMGHYNDQPHQFDGKRYGGFYTQEEIKEVVDYAAQRFITVIPEIEMPGHAQAPLAAYPEFGCTGEELEVWQLWGVSENVYCPKEETFAFLEDVLDEVMALFPSSYIHIGGDECPKIQWKKNEYCQQLMEKEGLKDTHELQSYFIKRIEKYINSKGRKMIGWDEILEGGLAPNATVMSWRGIEGGIEAAQSGHDVVMTPTSHCYFDYYQSDHPDEPLAIGGLISLEKIYHYEPIPEELNEEEANYILGAQGNLWTEYIPTFDKLEYMLLPRACALAEVVWSPKNKRDFDNFIERMTIHTKRLEADGVNIANHLYDLNSNIQAKDGKVNLDLSTLAKDATIYYTLDDSEPTLSKERFTNKITLSKSASLKAQAFVNDQKIGRFWSQDFDKHLFAGAEMQLKNNPHPKYSGDGNGSIINGVLGSNERYGDAEWLGFDGEDFEAILELQKPTTIKEIQFRFFNGEGQWIYLPKSIEVLTSSDSSNFKSIAHQNKIKGTDKVVEVIIPLDKVETQFVKIIVNNHGIIGEGRQGAGNKAWLFIDEIIAR